VLWRAISRCLGGGHRGLYSVLRAATRDLFIPAVKVVDPEILVCDAKLVDCCSDLLRQRSRAAIVSVRTELPAEPSRHAYPEAILCPEQLQDVDLGSESTRTYCEASVFNVAKRQPKRKDTAIRQVYVSIGTQAEQYRSARSVFSQVMLAFGGRADVRVTASVPWGNIPFKYENVEIQGWADQGRLISESDLAIVHGGLGGIKQCILAETPMVVVPFASDQPANARRIVKAGLGAAIAAECCEADGILRTCDEVMESRAMRNRLAEMASVFADAEELSPSVTVVERTA
jgi:UDP:flavonoid glycosyltransferase YjiC (YdhE family)